MFVYGCVHVCDMHNSNESTEVQNTQGVKRLYADNHFPTLKAHKLSALMLMTCYQL